MPSLTVVAVRESHNDAVVAQGQQVEHAVVVYIGRCQGNDAADFGRHGSAAKMSGALIGEYVQLALLIEKGRIRRAIVVEVGPNKRADIVQFRERLNRRERSVSIVTQNDQWPG